MLYSTLEGDRDSIELLDEALKEFHSLEVRPPLKAFYGAMAEDLARAVAYIKQGVSDEECLRQISDYLRTWQKDFSAKFANK